MKIPPYIEKGCSLSLVAPSFGCHGEPYKTCLKESIRYLRSLDYKVTYSSSVFAAKGLVASDTGEKRAEEFMKAYKGKSKAIISVGGGEMMCDMLPFIDFEEIRGLEPKWFMGFSDNTNLTFTLATLSDVMTVYGPCAPSFYKLRMEYSCEDALRMLKGEKVFKGYPKWELVPTKDEKHPLCPYNLTEKKTIKAVNYKGPVQGTFLGGCMDCLEVLCGTKYDKVRDFNAKHPEGIIWFLEACDLSPLQIHRALFQFKEAGWFSNAKAFLFGRHFCNDASVFGMDKYQAQLSVVEKLGVPVLMDVDLGHLPPSMPFICGGQGKAELVKENIKITYK